MTLEIRNVQLDELQAMLAMTLSAYRQYEHESPPGFWDKYVTNITEAVLTAPDIERIAAYVDGERASVQAQLSREPPRDSIARGQSRSPQVGSCRQADAILRGPSFGKKLSERHPAHNRPDERRSPHVRKIRLRALASRRLFTRPRLRCRGLHQAPAAAAKPKPHLTHRQRIDSSEVGAQGDRHIDRAVRLLVILQERNQDAR